MSIIARPPMSVVAVAAPRGVPPKSGPPNAPAAIAALFEYETSLELLVHTLEWCYNECQCDNRHFKELRTTILEMALLYRSVHLRAAKVLFQNLLEVMAYYSDLSFEEFIECAQDIIDAIPEYQKQAEMVLNLHSLLLADVLVLERKVEASVKAAAKEESECRKRGDQLHAKVNSHQQKAAVAIAGVVGFVAAAPFTGGMSLVGSLIAGVGYVHHCAKRDKAIEAAFSEARRAEDAQKAAGLIAEPISEAVQQLEKAVEKMVEFLQSIRSEVGAYLKRAKIAGNNLAREEAKKSAEAHFKMMKQPAQTVSLVCNQCLTKLPAIEVNLAVLVKYEGTTQSSYPQVWLKDKAPHLSIEM